VIDMDFEEVKLLSSAYLFQNYGREDICFSRGEKEFLYDLEGNRYTDYVAGIAVNALGHNHPALVRAISEQAQKMIHVSNLYYVQEQADLGEAIASIVPSPLGVSMFVNSGAEANEAALKLASKATGRKQFVACKNSFHGRTAGALSATGQVKYQTGFEPLLSQAFSFVPFNDPEAMKTAVTKETAGVMLEPVQGEGGVLSATREFVKTARDVCSDTGALLIIDEVQTGMGRTGKWFGFQHFNIVPDMITLAKALGGGVPIGALVSTREISKAFTPGSHGTTFGGNPLACAAACAVIDTMKKDKLVERSAELGDRWRSDLAKIVSGHEVVKDVRGIGLMTGIEMGDKAKEFQRYGLERRLLINVAAAKVVRVVPPLIISDASVRVFNDSLESFLSGQ
jgi:acetylornithine aminotransferase/acetylornithine/N-succinyldiaminopimelate aminotransferase